MKPIHMFSPLRKQPGYPTTSVKLTVADVTYDLILAANISDELLVHFIESEDSYRRVDRYCNAEGIDAIRGRPVLLDDEYRGLPTFAITFYGVDDEAGKDAMNGWAALRLAVGPLAARQLFNRACKHINITPELADYIISHDAYFKECGGFELLRIRSYFDADDRYQVMLDLDANGPSPALLKKLGRGKTRFGSFTAPAVR